MKKVMFAAAAFAVLGLASCKKEYTCTCTESVTGLSTSTTLKATKKDAKAACDKTVGTTTCAIK